MDVSNKVVNGLWIGDKLSSLELLTIHSFIKQGHVFHLWCYNELSNALPPELVLKDANDIIHFEKVFTKKESDPDYNVGKGSFGAPFSDLFRYKLLYEQGGWWVDMDVTCLQALDIEAPYYFRGHPILAMVGNVMKCPRHSVFMKNTYQEVLETCDGHTKAWLRPNEILNDHIAAAGLNRYIRDHDSNQDMWPEVNAYYYSDLELNAEWKFIHWMNEEWRMRKISKDAFYRNTLISKMMAMYDIEYSSKPKDFDYYWWHFKKNRLVQKLKTIIRPTK